MLSTLPDWGRLELKGVAPLAAEGSFLSQGLLAASYDVGMVVPPVLRKAALLCTLAESGISTDSPTLVVGMDNCKGVFKIGDELDGSLSNTLSSDPDVLCEKDLTSSRAFELIESVLTLASG